MSLLLEDEDLSHIIYLGELHRDQYGPPPDEPDPHPHVLRQLVPVHEHLLCGSYLLPQWIIDRVPCASLRGGRACTAHIGFIVQRCFRHHFVPFDLAECLGVRSEARSRRLGPRAALELRFPPSYLGAHSQDHEDERFNWSPFGGSLLC